MKHDGKSLKGIALGLGEVFHRAHSVQHQVAALQGIVRIDGGVVAGGLVHHSHQHGAFLNQKVRGLLAEELVRGAGNAIGVGTKEDGVQVHVHNLFLGVVSLQFDGRNPFLELDPDHLHLAHPFSAGIQGLGQLLGDGGAAALGGIPAQEGFEHHAGQGLDVHARMLIKALVFRGHGGLDQRGSQFVIAYESSVLYMVGGKDLSFLRNDLGGQLGVRVLQLLQGRDVRKGPDQAQQQEQSHERSNQKDPVPLDNFFLLVLSHLVIFSYAHKT